MSDLKKRRPRTLMCIAPFLCLVLTGCAEMNSQFDCPMKAGVHCASLDEVNAKIDRNELGSPLKKSLFSMGTKENDLSFNACLNKTCSGEALSHQRPLWQGGPVQHIWVAPFEDTVGNYHQESDIYRPGRSAYWGGAPLKAIDQDEE